MDGEVGLPSLIFVNVYCDDGVVGHGETYYLPKAVEAVVHDFAGQILLGADESRIAGHWRSMYDLCARFGARGAELRAISAIDLALWDIAGKRAAVPVYKLLGGAVRDRIPVYNTCGGPTYGRGALPAHGRTHGDSTMEDLDGFLTRPAELAQELLDYGFTAMKIWPFDRFAQERGGMRISASDLASGLSTFEQIRAAVGSRMDIMVEGHGFWSLSAAIRIARALEPVAPVWVEDLILAHQPGALRRLRQSTTIDLSVSEYLMTHWDYLPILAGEAADVVMIDPSWCGGITEGQKIASLADVYGLAVSMHDCTGPLTTLAGIHLAANAANANYQEVVRAYLHHVYPQWVDEVPVVAEGTVGLPVRPGLGADLDPKLGQRPGYRCRVSEVRDA
ncbi:MAG: mandelate racemase/muconate lactonizing enzyme family protein [Acidimicrobiales bacterium]